MNTEGAHPLHDREGDEEHSDVTDHEEPALKEPETPLWLPLVGIGLFLVAMLLFVVTRSEEPPLSPLIQGAEPIEKRGN